MRTFKTLLAAGLLTGLALTTTVPAMAAPSSAPVAAAPAEPLLTADKAQVRAGNTLVLRLEHGTEGINWISSAAFVRNGEHPFGADEGLAQVVNDRDGHAEAVATIADVPPGEYDVHTRIGGSAGPTMKITVTK